MVRLVPKKNLGESTEIKYRRSSAYRNYESYKTIHIDSRKVMTFYYRTMHISTILYYLKMC